MTLIIWPAALPDESLYSWVARAGVLNAVSDAFRFCQLISSTQIKSVPECRPSQLVLQGVAADEGGTRLFLDDLSLRNLSRQLEKAADPAGELTSSAVGWCTPTLGSVSRWKFCNACIESDLEQYGVAYWHLSHQMGMVPVCSTHNAALKRYVVPTALARDQLLLPLQLKGRMAVDLQELVLPQFAFWREFSGLCYSALHEPSPSVTYAAAAQSIQSALHAKGVVYSEKSGCYARLSKSFGEEMQLLLQSGYPPGGYSDLKPQQALRKWHARSPIELDDILMIVFWLFGSWGAFRERCAWEQYMLVDALKIASEPSPQDSFLAMRTRHRAVCAKYLREAALPNRADFLRENPKSLRWLLEYDQKWLEDLLPLPSRRRQFRLFE